MKNHSSRQLLVMAWDRCYRCAHLHLQLSPLALHYRKRIHLRCGEVMGKASAMNSGQNQTGDRIKPKILKTFYEKY